MLSSASLLAPADKQSYERLQARELLLDISRVLDFVNMKRFDDPGQLRAPEAMRTKGGGKHHHHHHHHQQQQQQQQSF